VAPPSAEIDVHAAAFAVALIRSGSLDEAEEFIEWYLETFDRDISHVLPAELEAD
jgi:hypothetical protein